MAVKFEAKLPTKVPASVAVYDLPAQRVGATMVRDTAKALGLGPDGDVITSPDVMAYNAGRHHLEITRASGAVALYHRDKHGREPKQSFDLSDRRAEAIARRFLEKAKVVPPKAAKLARVTHMRSGVAEMGSRRAREQVVDAGVFYRRTIGNLEVEGPGGFVMVTVDPEGDVIAFKSIWRKVGKRVGTVRIKKPEEAMRELEEYLGKLRGDVTVKKASLGYFELGPLDRQRVIQPAYAFVYVVQTEQVAMKSAFVTHAGHKSFGPLIGKRRFPAPRTPTRKQ